MSKKIQTFDKFKTQCQETFEAFSQHSTMYDLRVWDAFPGDLLKERQCWYCCVRLNKEVQMMITYDPDDDDPEPYVCWYDFPNNTITYSHWAFHTLEEAMLFIRYEPNKAYRHSITGNYCILRRTKNKFGLESGQSVVGLSLLGILDYIKNTPNIPSGIWEIREFGRYPNSPWDASAQYKIEIKTEYHSDVFVYHCAPALFPDRVYEKENLQYFV